MNVHSFLKGLRVSALALHFALAFRGSALALRTVLTLHIALLRKAKTNAKKAHFRDIAFQIG